MTNPETLKKSIQGKEDQHFVRVTRSKLHVSEFSHSREFGLRNAFKTMDKDQTGSVTKKELQDYFATDNGSHIEKEKVDKILKYLEIEDDDGQVK